MLSLITQSMPRISSIVCAEGSNGAEWVYSKEGKVTQHLPQAYLLELGE